MYDKMGGGGGGGGGDCGWWGGGGGGGGGVIVVGQWLPGWAMISPVMCSEINLENMGVMWQVVMTSSNGNIFRVTGPLWGESTGDRWIPLTKASDAELWYFLWSAPEQTVEQTINTPVIWDAIALIMTSL